MGVKACSDVGQAFEIAVNPVDGAAGVFDGAGNSEGTAGLNKSELVVDQEKHDFQLVVGPG